MLEDAFDEIANMLSARSAGPAVQLPSTAHYTFKFFALYLAGLLVGENIRREPNVPLERRGEMKWEKTKAGQGEGL